MADDKDKLIDKIRIEFIFRPTRLRKFFLKKYIGKQLTQGEPIEYGLRITNLADMVFPGATATNLSIQSTTENAVLSSAKTLAIQTLNCSQSIDLWFDRGLIPFKGTVSIQVTLQPIDPSRLITTYQRDNFHCTDDASSKTNSWVNIVYIEGELELIQRKTNSLILWLTVITVLESVFGLNNILKFIGAGLYNILLSATKFLQYLLGI